LAEIRLDEVTKRFGNTTAVDRVDLRAEDTEFLVLVGPSGCGKTTTLRMVAGLEEITDGRIYIGERMVNHVPPKDRDIAMVFQNYALYPHMSVHKNLAFGLKQRKFPRPEINQRVREVAKLLGIEELLNRKPKELSGGQRQRVAMGRAIVRKPQVFLFDEPGNDDYLRDPRPDRGHDPRGPDRRHAPGQNHADRKSHGGLQQSPKSLCSRVYRQSRHELLGGPVVS
jgi:multiple sugar transport system ATP-binding protein